MTFHSLITYRARSAISSVVKATQSVIPDGYNRAASKLRTIHIFGWFMFVFSFSLLFVTISAITVQLCRLVAVYLVQGRNDSPREAYFIRQESEVLH